MVTKHTTGAKIGATEWNGMADEVAGLQRARFGTVALETFDGATPERLPAAVRETFEWTAAQLDRRHRDFLAGFASHMAMRSVVAVDVNLPTLNDFRIRESRRMLEAVARRTGR